ncbi:LacI family DNA-binding transcriptional regulator [Streptomyces aidingensis]|uniref:LacI family transcriptional regulator n=1 Tax=Streptomyces aidingensis TaxID=910347 RepID=A0A1I1QWZ1_9ACTN|nr:LacI family DNA-binding transcriptional regulator [Streptomyces aidingensis]SFD26664.1 LacI family transcriptional regulator [Streptomyces aidingensis]
MADRDPTIYEVAQRAGVSISTVSLALNQPTRVTSPTRERILAAADELGFVPKVRAVTQARRGLGRIAAVAPFTSYPSFSRRLAGALTELADDGTQLFVVDTKDIAVSDSPVLASMPVRGHVDGVLIFGVLMEDTIARRLKERLPTILLDTSFPGLPSISVDFREGGRIAGRHLRELGHRHVAFVNETERFKFDSPATLLIAGLRDVMGYDAVHEYVVPRGTDGGRLGVDAVLAEPDEPTTAIMAVRDLLAIGAVAELRRRGVRVPEDMSVVGFDDDPVAEALGLTTVRHPFEESGRLAVRALRERLESPGKEIADRRLELALKARETTGPPPGCPLALR